jgi:hypothetical protein
MDKLRIVVGGYIGLFPSGGVIWDYIQYPLGLKRLGHDVYYIEDTRQYPCFQTGDKAWDDPTDTIAFLKETMEKFGLGERWAYRDEATGNCFGISLEKIKEICRTADIFINISGANYILREEYENIPKRVLIDSDPMFTQVQYWDDSDKEASFTRIKDLYSFYNYRFSFGENIDGPESRIPLFDLKWIPTRQPICLDAWKTSEQTKTKYGFTTVMNWSVRSKLKYNNEEWGQKDVEFEKVMDIPHLVKGAAFDIIVSLHSHKSPNYIPQKIKEAGWEILDPTQTINTAEDYKLFIQQSLAEFSIAKETYVKSNSGWFSCRSACYLAAGKPVITQDTMWSKYIPSGEGLFAFSDKETALRAISKVLSNEKKHAAAALEIAKEYFDSNKVLNKMLEQLNRSQNTNVKFRKETSMI